MINIGTEPGEVRNFAVQAEHLTKDFSGEYAINDVSVSIPRGNIFGLIGPSGSGKTTTIRLLTGIYEPTSGRARVLGRDPRHFTPGEREKIGYMPQHFVLFKDLSVWENLNFAASLYGLGIANRRSTLNSLLDFVELTEHRKKLAREISGGMQRRLSLAATLVHNPELLFLDEPTAGIDPVLREKFWGHFRQIQQEGHTIFITTQYVGEAAYCHYIGVMVEGRLIMVDTPTGLRRRAFNGDVVDLQTLQRIPYEQLAQFQKLPFIIGQVRFVGENDYRITVSDASTAIPDIINWCNNQGIDVNSINEFLPPFDDIFVALVEKETKHG